MLKSFKLNIEGRINQFSYHEKSRSDREGRAVAYREGTP